VNHRRRLLDAPRTIAVLLALTLTACGAAGDTVETDAPAPTAGDGAATGQPDATAPPSVTDSQPSADIDACALVTQDEVESIVGMAVGAPEPEDAPPPFFGCRYEDDEILPVVTVGIIASESTDDAVSLFEFGADQYPAVEGLGDRAYRSQPIDEITVLAGRYELSVGLYFVSEDDDAEFEMAREIAELVLSRLP
jgi:hypothetical protein